ncbi:hypothetical protein LWI29_016518 [Acer saccharum]|uniref:O-fucosyltransferase family protein n=1 Tax=Acer saccharum TaxID=4024 RepID=A0AA39RQ85_ACESA|nr:hypothetical protein LWI29_016518 [Acer saccharum]
MTVVQEKESTCNRKRITPDEQGVVSPNRECSDSGLAVEEVNGNSVVWNIEDEISKVIETGVALGCNFSGREESIREVLKKREVEDYRRDSTVDSGNNNFLSSTSKSNYPPFGVDFADGKPTGRFSNGRIEADFIAQVVNLPFPPPCLGLSKEEHKTLRTGVNYGSSSCGVLTDIGKLFAKDDTVAYINKEKPSIKMYGRLLNLASGALVEKEFKQEKSDFWVEPYQQASVWKHCADRRTPNLGKPNESNGYILVSANGGLNQQEVAICNAVAVVSLLNSTLVLPRFLYSNVWKDPRPVYPVELRRLGRCPMTPEEVALLLSGLGFKGGTYIYLAGSSIYGGKSLMHLFTSLYPNLVTKETLLTPNELEPFRNFSSQMAALNFIACATANVLAMTDSGSQLSSLVSGF